MQQLNPLGVIVSFSLLSACGAPEPGLDSEGRFEAVASQVTATWTDCAGEGQRCVFSGPREVRYGANGKFNTATFTDGVNCNNQTFGDPIPGTVKRCAYGPAAQTWTRCANENQACNFTGTRVVRYGANGTFASGTFTSSVNCSNGVFGDPVPGRVKACDYASTQTTPPTPGVQWSNIRVVGNRIHDRFGKPFAIRGIESMYGDTGRSNPTAWVAGHKALGANSVGPLPQPGSTSAATIEALVDAAYKQGLVIGVNGDHTGSGQAFFQRSDIVSALNRYPNVFIQEAVELGSMNSMTESQWVALAKSKIDGLVSLYPDKPIKIGSPSGGRSPRYALNRCQEVVNYYNSKGGRGGVIFTAQLYWKAGGSGTSWYQMENGFSSGLTGILEAVDEMADSPCMFMPGLDHQDDVGYTGWREIMAHVRAIDPNANTRLSHQWWVYHNAGDPYDNDLTTNQLSPMSGITTVGREVKTQLEVDRRLIDLGPLR